MKKRNYWLAGASAILALSLTACGNENKESSTSEGQAKTEQSDSNKEAKANNESKTQTITYLGKKYELPTKTDRIVAASLESMEDAAVLGVKPVGVLEVGGSIPEYLKRDLDDASLIGNKMEPNNEAIVKLKPDVILGSSKFQESVASNLNKIQTMIPYSHLSENWEENLRLLGKLSNKESEADKVISDYQKDAKDATDKLGGKLKNKDVLVLRIRQGSLAIYSKDVYLNSVLYEDLGLKVPAIVEETEAQAELSLEALANANPDYIFLQFESSENPDNAKALDETLNNPIFKSVKAAKANHVFVNAIDPLAQGGTAWSKVRFLDAAVDNLSK